MVVTVLDGKRQREREREREILRDSEIERNSDRRHKKT
jgi:hypothetical protein